MANPSDKQMLRDANGDLIPQYWNDDRSDFEKLNGNRVKETILDREIRTRTTKKVVDVPNYAVGVMFFLHNWSGTGTFSDGDGSNMSIGLYHEKMQPGGFGVRSIVKTEPTTEFRIGYYDSTSLITIHPSISNESYGNRRLMKSFQITLPDKLLVNLLISGEFEEGEGIECGLYAVWQSR